MPGFFISNSVIDVELNNRYPENCLQEELTVEKHTVKRNTLNKFMKDKAFSCNKHTATILDGYLLNKKELFKKYNANNAAQLMEQMYLSCGDVFFKEFRGSFAGAILDREKNKWLIFTNQTGENALYYAQNAGTFYVGSQVNYVIDAWKQNNKQLSLDEQAVYQMLTYGYMADDSTYANEIKRLQAGMYLCVENSDLKVKEYHRFKKDRNRLKGKNEQELIDLVDEQFKNAVRLEYEKDNEYGYNHISDMSGGLDCRMAAWVAHTLKPKHIQLLTYCKANYLDELIAKQIAAYWKDEILVKPLDDISFLYEIDELVKMNGGLSLYSGITGGKRMLESLNWDHYGLEHTGMIGDVVIGSFLTEEPTDSIKNMPTGMYSEKLLSRLDPKVKSLYNRVKDYEIFLIYVRGLQGAANSIMIRKNYTEVAAPFMNPDFLQLCLDIPIELRANHRLYIDWIINKYPDAAKFKWESIGAKITDSKLIRRINAVRSFGMERILEHFGYKCRNKKNNMNPLDYWISQNQDIKRYMDEYEKNGYQYIPAGTSKQLIEDIKALYQEGNASEKAMALTALSAIKLYFSQQ